MPKITSQQLAALKRKWQRAYTRRQTAKRKMVNVPIGNFREYERAAAEFQRWDNEEARLATAIYNVTGKYPR